MSHAPKPDWRPGATIDTLRYRAEVLQTIRAFFAKNKVLEVETPLMGTYTVTDPYIDSIQTDTGHFLQTSPEYAMKRLLAAGSGPIYQICKAFRKEEAGRYHQPEFTMLEWYRPGFDIQDLMDEMEALLQTLHPYPTATRTTYQSIFLAHTQIDPLECTLADLAPYLSTHQTNMDCLDTALQWTFSEVIEPRLDIEAPCFIYDFPASQAALAKIDPKNPKVAKRFELYINGLELANGFDECQDATIQRIRFEENNKKRSAQDKPILDIDEDLLAALEHGLPQCAGVAMGIDRLIQCMIQLPHINMTNA